MRILLTRPEADSERVAKRLRALGHETVIAPLMHIAIERSDLQLPAGLQGLLFTSANGVRAFAAQETAGQWFGVPVFAVGAATAAAARDAGVGIVAEAGGDVAALASLVSERCDPKDGPLVHIAGSVQAGDLAGDLGARGFEVARLVLYAAEAAKALPDEAAAALAAGRIDGVLLYSPRSAKLFAALCAKAGLGEAVRHLHVFCLSQAVADGLAAELARSAAREAAQPHVPCHVAAEPTELALLQCVAETALSQSPE